MRKTKWVRLMAAASVVAVLAAACGDDDGDEETTTTEASESSADEETTTSGEPASVTEEAAPDCTGESDGKLVIGELLPATGSLAFLGPPEFAGAELAVQDVNAAGGVLGEDVELLDGDSGDTSTDTASQTVDGHLEAGADAILGAASSGVSFTVIDKITGACKIHFSPANTSPDFTEYDDGDLYFRTAPSDVLQGRVLSDLMIEEGVETAAIMALQDPYGEGLLKYTKEPFEEQGGTVAVDLTYDPNATTFDAEVDQIVAAGTDAIVVIGFAETSKILTSMFDKGATPDKVKIYLVDGNVGNALGEEFTDAGALSGIAGTLPAAEVTSDFKDRLLEVDSELTDFSYAPETYDAVVIMALAAEIAGTDDAAQIAAHINGVTRDGTKCTTYEECKALVESGEDIDYDGPSGPQTFQQEGEPTEASFAILRYGEGTNSIDDSLTVYKFAKI
jgi:ABC-type branched-subunit amino acid transport system substrate-binding protein